MEIEIRRGSIRVEYDKPIKRTVTGYGDIFIDGKLYIGKSTLRYMDNDVHLSKIEIQKVIQDVAKSKYGNLVVFDDE